MSYIRKHGNGLMGFGDASSCGSTQQWDANCNYNGIQGQCVPTGMVGKSPGCTYPSSSGGGWFDTLIKGATDVLKAKVTPAPVTNISSGAGGMGTTTKLVIAGSAVVGGVLLLRALKK